MPVAAWFHFVRRKAAQGERVNDPLAQELSWHRHCMLWRCNARRVGVSRPQQGVPVSAGQRQPVPVRITFRLSGAQRSHTCGATERSAAGVPVAGSIGVSVNASHSDQSPVTIHFSFSFSGNAPSHSSRYASRSPARHRWRTGNGIPGAHASQHTRRPRRGTT